MERDLTAAASRDASLAPEETQSAVSWAAIFAGAAAALALSFTLLGLVAGFGLKVASPWPGTVSSTLGFTPAIGAWMIVVQVLSSALGGYLAGRLRTKWRNVHDHEVHFRDTAHGLLVWAVSTLAGVILVATVLAPQAQGFAGPAAAAMLQTAPPVSAADLSAIAEREAQIAAQASLFMAFGLLLGAFTAAVAAAIGGLRRDEMHTKVWLG